MTKVPFTPQGFNQKQSELYALSNADLEVQANLIRKFFVPWVENNFILERLQLEYVARIPKDQLFIISNEIASSVVTRSKITLELAVPPVKSSKVFEIIKNVFQRYLDKYSDDPESKSSDTIPISQLTVRFSYR